MQRGIQVDLDSIAIQCLWCPYFTHQGHGFAFGIDLTCYQRHHLDAGNFTAAGIS